jgi:protoporphyrinogen oxidase
MNNQHLMIIGAGPAGLAAARESTLQGTAPTVLEKADRVGGIARTEAYKGYRFDIGGHRFYTQVKEVQAVWQEMLGEDFPAVARMSRIYYRGRFFAYPLELFNTLSNLGPLESLLILLSYLKAKLWPLSQEETFEQWVTNRFGRRLFQTFFQTYTEKVWGIPCHQIQAEWAGQRIKGLSLTSAVSDALLGGNNAKSLIKAFHYPTHGPGMMWQRFLEQVQSQGGQFHLNTEVIRLRRERGRITGVTARADGRTIELPGQHFISSMPLDELIARLDPPPPSDVLQAARHLNYRAFVIVVLIVNRADLFPDQWIYVHSPEVRVGRIQNFKNWSAALVPDPDTTSLGMEYFCDIDDDLWAMPDAELVELATRELASLELAGPHEVVDAVILRQPKAYPVYDLEYRQHLGLIRQFLATVDNLQTIGRNGMHRYNNQDHSMLTGMLAVRNLQGQNHDLWTVNTESAYYEQGPPGRGA